MVPTHVLQNLFTVVVLVTTRVLIGPLDGENRTLVVVEATHIVSTTIVVLGVKKSNAKKKIVYITNATNNNKISHS